MHCLFRSNDRYIPIVITIINSEGGSDELLLAVQAELSDVNIGIEIQVSFLVTTRHGRDLLSYYHKNSFCIISIDGCQSETTIIPSVPADPELEIRINWPEINIGQEAIVRCPCEDVDLGFGNLRARRYCGGTFTEGAHWETEYIAPCNFTNRAREMCSLVQVCFM